MRAFLSNVRRHGAAVVVTTLVSVTVAIGALAQSEPETPEVTPAAEDPQSTSGQLAAAERAVANGHALETALTQRLDAANGRSDIVMVDCLTPLRTQLEATLASADSRLRALRLLARGGDEAAAHHEYTMVMVASQRFGIVEADMNQCLGDADIATGDDRVTVEVTIDLPDEEPAAPAAPVPTVPVPYVPPPLSPAF